MTAEIVKALLELLKLAPRYFVAFGVVAGVLLYADEQLLQHLGVAQFAKDNRSVMGLALLGSIALLLVGVCIRAGALVDTWRRKRKFQQRMTERLHALTEDEKQILRFYIGQETRSNTLRIDDGVVQGLVAARIIYRAAAQGSIIEGFAHNISDFAWQYLNEYPDLLDGSTDIARTDRHISLY
ncbi:MAG: super-infection exclusion protein B [Burkholderiaceae bacterium]